MARSPTDAERVGRPDDEGSGAGQTEGAAGADPPGPTDRPGEPDGPERSDPDQPRARTVPVATTARPVREREAGDDTASPPARSAGWRQRLEAAGRTARDRLSGFELAAGAVLLAGLAVVVIVGIVTGDVWAWLLVVLLLATLATAAVFALDPEVATTRTRRPRLGGRRRPAPVPDVHERAATAPFVVRTSLSTRHQLRLTDAAARPGQVAVPVSGGHRVQVLLEGRSEERVELRELRPVVTARNTPRPGEPVVTSTAALPAAQFDLDLGADPPRLVPVDDGPAGLRFPLTIGPGHLELLVLTPRCDRHEVDWYLEMDWACGGRRGTLRVDLGERPFQVTSETGWTTFYPDGGPPVRSGWT